MLVAEEQQCFTSRSFLSTNTSLGLQVRGQNRRKKESQTDAENSVAFGKKLKRFLRPHSNSRGENVLSRVI
jgi:hypothetical protein